jgi:hypothetical protein
MMTGIKSPIAYLETREQRISGALDLLRLADRPVIALEPDRRFALTF